MFGFRVFGRLNFHWIDIGRRVGLNNTHDVWLALDCHRNYMNAYKASYNIKIFLRYGTAMFLISGCFVVWCQKVW